MNCQNCGVLIHCSKNNNCWCIEFPNILNLNAGNCYCKDCLKYELKQKINSLLNQPDKKIIEKIKKLGSPQNLVEDIDYYINKNDQFVFTKWYHLRKGYCCKNDCLHCPY